MDKLQPVAWMQVHYKDGTPTKFSKVQTWEDDIPLYTHPADLTDEEMISIYEKDWSGIKCGLGRAIEQATLRKAQEK